ncbi:SMP-30/gluconolactonase/LRE family protein [Jiangella asiatica]|uniref:SMP-30/gluconolactonase/LRE family protein n=1 Tax=Jiangella asiatica TaxID=2530372 RepID=A0A4V2Z2P8_9ACTN|nr:SMP-30/gluconolactonase/LRE family protein [Jiangella asiatica]TDE09698.1 SMP-30/gluconolactonase/LRE family protein [Jiangella asiatica]
MINVVADGLDHPECVAWGPDGFAYAGGEAGQLYRIHTGTGDVTVAADNGGWILGLALDAQANAYTCNPTHRAVECIQPGGEATVYSYGTTDRPMVAPNYPVFATDGTLYVSDSGDWQGGNGCVYRIEPSGRTTVWTEATPQFPNGLALDAEGRHLYVVESTLPGVVRLTIGSDGEPGLPELVIALPGCVPDGLAFDREGGLYISCYRPDRIYYLSTDHRLLIVADDYQGTSISAPTNVAFYGAELDRLLVASLGRWHIGSLDVDVPGQALHYPELTSDSRTVIRDHI